MALVVEVVVDRGVIGREFLQALDISEPRHRPFPPSKRLVRVFRPDVEPTTGGLGGHSPTPKVSSETRVHSGVYEKLAEVSLRRPPPAHQPGPREALVLRSLAPAVTLEDAPPPVALEDGVADRGPATDIQAGEVSAHALFNALVLSILCSISQRYFCCAPGHVIIENITARSASSRSKAWLWSE